MKLYSKIILLLLSLVLITWSCKKEPLPDIKEEASVLTQKVNQFIEDAMGIYYLWHKELPEIDIKYELDSEDYFYKLLYEEDKWSFITDDVEALISSLEGIETTFGYSLAFGKFTDTETYFAIVEFVYPNTPAEEAGIKRGDIIVLIDNGDINQENYKDLLYAENVSLTLGVLSNGSISIDSTVSLTSEELSLNPVLFKKVIEEGDHKIGYLFYAQYITDFNSSLDQAFQYFIDEQITDLVIDLRYNPGGYSSAAQRLCSSVAPLDVVNSNNTLVTFQWNDILQAEFEKYNREDLMEIKFKDNVPVKMGLNDLYILTGTGTASASELTITGLKPYMNVTTIGDTTYGKYTGSQTIRPDWIYNDSNYYEEFDNWGLQPIVFRYANSIGVTDFKDGFSPDILVEDEGLLAGIPLGVIEDPLLRAAIERIIGYDNVAIKSAKKSIPDFTIFDRGFSKFDANKRELVNDLFDENFINMK